MNTNNMCRLYILGYIYRALEKKRKKNYIYTSAKLVFTSGHCPVYNTLPKQEKGSQSWEKNWKRKKKFIQVDRRLSRKHAKKKYDKK